MQQQFVAFQRQAQIERERASGVCALVHVAIEEAIGIFAAAFALIKREVGEPQDVMDAVFGREGDTDADADANDGVVDGEGRVYRLDEVDGSIWGGG